MVSTVFNVMLTDWCTGPDRLSSAEDLSRFISPVDGGETERMGQIKMSCYKHVIQSTVE